MQLPLLAKLYAIPLSVVFIASQLVWFVDGFSLATQILVIVVLFIGCLVLCRMLLTNVHNGFAALEMGLLNLKDGDFSTTLAYNEDDEFGRLCRLYNDTTLQLQKEKQWVYQRELMLDKVLQSSPQALVLVNSNQQVVFSNYAARDLFNQSSKLEGMAFDALQMACSPNLKQALQHAREGLFSIQNEHQEAQTWHLSVGEFLLNNQQHKLYILKQMTRELSRQEVMVWKKVIRIISHELNNSLGPISSMLHSGKLLTERVDEPRLARVFSTIDERIAHLTEFVQGYGKFAKLPTPKPAWLNWLDIIRPISQQWSCHYDEASALTFYGDKVQIEQLIINLLKNAHESGGPIDAIAVKAKVVSDHFIIEVVDEGKGMSEHVMTNALVPFYSTKNAGSGLGLALCREIAEAHHGQIALFNRKPRGLCVRVSLPLASA
ncbi:Sensor histidine kinase [Pseudoalteromonas luteoviolacea B = ATCC 29581]|nr:Sensor histidine kinase [Pseudoalteromonas luteoviolacea B = ATCC 29581]